MEKILCPVDFSDSSDNAIIYAAQLAAEKKLEVTLFTYYPSITVSAVFADLSLEKAIDRLRERADGLSRSYNISCYAEINPSATSLENALNEQAPNFDMIVMGTNGADDLLQYFFGSNTYRTAKNVSAPLLLVPEKCTYHPINHMVYAFNFPDEKTLPTRQIIPWVKLNNSKVTVLNVLSPEHAEVKGTSNLQYAIPENWNLKTITGGETGLALHHFMQEGNADALALCSIDRNPLSAMLHKSVIKQISHIADYPVYIVRE